MRFLNRHYVTGVETRRVAGAGGSLRRIAALHVVEVERRGVLEDAERVREILVSHRVPAGRSERRGRASTCDVVVNCLGAWSPIFSAKVGVTDVTEPVRRQICLVDVHASDLAPGVELDSLGHDRRRERPLLPSRRARTCSRAIRSPTRAAASTSTTTATSFFETHIWPRLAHRVEQLRALRARARLVRPLRSDARPQRDRRRGSRFRELLRGPRVHGARRDAVVRGRAARWRSGSTPGASARSTCRRSTARASRDPERWVTEALHI